MSFAEKFRYLQFGKDYSMRKVIGIGETVLDIIFKNDRPIGAVPGGSTFNSVISLGRAGIDTTFIGEIGDDRVGRNVISFLRDNNVNADYVNVYADCKSPVSLAFLDDNNNAEYIFYKDTPRGQLDFSYPEVNADDIVMFGSFYSVNPILRPQVAGFLDYARSHGAILYYDVNFRASHRADFIKVTPNILENFEYADIVRGSTEDFDVMFRKTDPDAVYRSEISFYCRNFVCTQGSGPVALRTVNGFNKDYPVASTNTVSTIGAGDNFNAGFAYGLIKYGIKRADIEAGLTEKQWDNVIGCAQMFSADCCRSIDNYINTDFGAKMKAELAAGPNAAGVGETDNVKQ